jgi:phosphoesterase RecJ-like protein
MNSEITTTVKKLLDAPRNIVIIGHKNPDGDAVGSCLALYFFLQKLGHNPTVIVPNDFPNFLKWLPGAETVLIYEKDINHCRTLVSETDLIFTLDFNSLTRVGIMQNQLEKSDAQFVMIDHHQQPGDYAVAAYSDTQMSSTCEMVYVFIESLGGLHFLDWKIATNLYTGIMTDTGSFRFPSTSASTHRKIANLIEAGAENTAIHQNIYDTNSPDKMKLLGVALNNLVILPEYNTAYISLTQSDLDGNNFRKGDTEGFVNYALSIKDIVFAVIFIENKQDNIIKMSLRSKGDFSVNDVARTHYNGGGHINAAGGRSSHSLSRTISEFISILPAYKTALSK